ncbi:MAG: hypothetical protein LBI64_05785, partial [Coriobacteriales bacterium]|nr:hypothetical protein [Coriobacteriales bacterium]
EEGTTIGGFGSAVLEELAHLAISQPRVLTIGIPDTFVTHGSIQQLFAELGMDASHLLLRIQDALDGDAAA